MATKTEDGARTYVLGDINTCPMVADDIIYEGSAVGDNGSGYARPLVAGDPFRGFAFRKVDNSGGSAGDVSVEVQARGIVVLDVVGAGITSAQAPVYASDDDTYTLTVGSNTRIGYVHRWIAGTSCEVAFDATRP